MKYKLIVEDGSKEVYSKELNYSEVSDFASSLDDSLENTDIFKILIQHPSNEVRERIASKDRLDGEVCEYLENEKSINVIRSYIRSDASKVYATEEQLLGWIELDIEIASSIASYVERFENINLETVVKHLMKQSDPSILSDLASNSSLPKKYLKELAKNGDSKIARYAKESLS